MAMAFDAPATWHDIFYRGKSVRILFRLRGHQNFVVKAVLALKARRANLRNHFRMPMHAMPPLAVRNEYRRSALRYG